MIYLMTDPPTPQLNHTESASKVDFSRVEANYSYNLTPY